MGSFPRSTRPVAMVPGLLATIVIVGMAGARAEGPMPPEDGVEVEVEVDRRIAWTTSRLTGTPEGPLPYVAEVAFPGLRFDRPIFLAQAPGSRRLVVAELGGKVVSFPEDRGATRADVALDLARSRPGFGSLLGLAFHPRYEDNRAVFLCYTLPKDKADGTRVSRFTMDRADPPRIDPESEEVAITWMPGGHNGGCLAFGPDGFLYISTGDAAAPSPPDPLATGQDLGDLLSSILRIDVDRRDPGRGYRVPPDNPFVAHPGARPEIWAYGLRNPWRMSFDREDGDLWVGDVGWELWEMIYKVVPGGNYGWSINEGRQQVRPEAPRGPTPILPPTTDHPHSEAASITGGYVNRGGRLKDLVGTYIYGDFQSGKVWGLRPDGRRIELADTGLHIVSFGEDRAGELYLIDYDRTNQVYRLRPNPAPASHRDFPRTLSRTGLFASTREHTPAAGVVAYAINAEMWADGARADRFLAIPGTGQIDGEGDEKKPWRFPEGSVLARTVSLDVRVRQDDAPRRQRLETQVLHREGGAWRPYTYIWDDDQGDATLADAWGSSRRFFVRDERATGGWRGQDYRFAARSECLLCHNPWVEASTTVFGTQSASPLAFNAAQVGRIGPGTLAGEDQPRRLERIGFFARPQSPGVRPRLADPYDEGAGLDARARAYLEVNCAHCHRRGAGGSADIVLSSSHPLGKTRTLGVRPLQGTFGIEDASIIAPGEPERSILYYRMAKAGAGHMPRIGSERIDEPAIRLIADWIASLPADHPAPLVPQDAEALACLETPTAATTVARGASIRHLTASTRGALALLRRIDGGAIPRSTAREVADLTKDDPRAEIRDLFERFLPDSDRVARLGDAVDLGAILARAGDAGRGRHAFFAESANACKSCHRIGGEGKGIGPDLDAVGSKYPRRELLRQVVEPSHEVDPKYAVHAVATSNGQVHHGLLVEKTADAIVLRDAQDRMIRIPLAEVEQQAILPKSLMPDGLLRDLTAQQAADLLEYLSSLKAR